MRNKGRNCIAEGPNCQIRTFRAYGKRVRVPREIYSVLCSTFGFVLRMKREGTRKEKRLSKPYVLWPLSPSGACSCKILENQGEDVTLVPLGASSSASE